VFDFLNIHLILFLYGIIMINNSNRYVEKGVLK